MSTNLSPEAKLAEQEYQNATNIDDKIVKLERYIALIPKHKATEKMVARLRSSLVKLKADAEEKRIRQRSIVKGPSWVIGKDGDAQISLVGVANSGKSSLLNALTSTNAKIGDYPYTTEKPEPGVLDCKGAILQLIDLPSIFTNVRTESKNGAMLLSQIRSADLIILVIDLTDDPIAQMKVILDELNNGGIRVNKKPPAVELKKIGAGGALIFGDEKIDASREDILEIMHDQGLFNFSIKILKPITLSDLVEVLDASLTYNKGIIVANKGDQPGSKENYQKLVDAFSTRFDIYPVSANTSNGLEQLREAIFTHLGLIRIRSKEPNGGIAEKPIVLEEGATVGDVAKIIHSRFYEHFRQAKIYGPSAKFDGQSVGLNHKLKDGDIVEIFAD